MTPDPSYQTISLSEVFEPERKALEMALSSRDMTAAQIVSEARRALDRTAMTYAKNVTDPALQKAGVWLLEMVKSSASVLDQGAKAHIVWHEVPPPKDNNFAGQGVFYLVALALAGFGFLQESRLAMMTALILAGLRAVAPDNWAFIKSRIPFLPKPKALADETGRQMSAEAHVIANNKGFVDTLADSLRTADHVLRRLADPKTDAHWAQDRRLMGFVQGLLEAHLAQDGDFALKLVGQQLDSILEHEGIEKIEYSAKTAALFDVLPAAGQDTPKLAAPALKSGEEVICRGTVWGPDGG